MINIDFTIETVCGEPGPNLYWYGNKNDFFKLACMLYLLGENDGYKICLPCKVDEHPSEIFLISKCNGKILNKVMPSKKLIIELDSEIWRDILLKIYLLSMTSGREYIDLDEYQDIQEDANFIIDSSF